MDFFPWNFDIARKHDKFKHIFAKTKSSMHAQDSVRRTYKFWYGERKLSRQMSLESCRKKFAIKDWTFLQLLVVVVFKRRKDFLVVKMIRRKANEGKSFKRNEKRKKEKNQ